MKRGRGYMSGGMWDGEYDSETDVDHEKRLAELEAGDEDASGSTETLTGVPQCATPFLVTSRVDANGLVYPVLGFRSLAANLRRFWPTIRKVKHDGTYGPERRHPGVKINPEDLAVDFKEVEWHEGLPPNFTWDCVLIEAKLTDSGANDGGNLDQEPDPYTSKNAPDGTELGRFSTGAGQTGPEADNEIMNGKFRYSIDAWNPADDDGGAAGPNKLAKWRYGTPNALGGDPSSQITTDVANGNYWQKVFTGGVPPACLVLTSSVVTRDPCARLEKTPFDAGEPFNMSFIAKLHGVPNSVELLHDLIVTLEDSIAGVIATTQKTALGLGLSNFEWREVRLDEVFVEDDYAQAVGAKQWVRLHLTGSIGAGRAILIDKARAGHMAGAYRPHHQDRQRANDPDAGRQGGQRRGAVGYGRTGAEVPAGVGGQVIRSAQD